jgi:hypothetical protein
MTPTLTTKVFHTDRVTGNPIIPAKAERANMVKKKAKKFSTVKAVKANARERVGQPKAERIIEDKPREARRKAKHKPTLNKILSTEE